MQREVRRLTHHTLHIQVDGDTLCVVSSHKLIYEHGLVGSSQSENGDVFLAAFFSYNLLQYELHPPEFLFTNSSLSPGE